MKKTISIILSLLFLMQAVAVNAENGDLLILPPETKEEATEQITEFNTVGITLSIKDGYCHSAEANVELSLSDGEKTYKKEITISEDAASQEVIFDVDTYTLGKEFKIAAGYQIEKLFLGEQAGQELTFKAEPQIKAEYIPAMHNAVKLIYNQKPLEFSLPARNIGEHVIVPIDELAASLELLYSDEEGIYKLSSAFSTLSVENGEIYIEKLGMEKKKEETGVGIQDIGGKLFIPISAVSSAFNLDLIMDMTDEMPILYAATGDLSKIYIPNNTYVNEKGLSSDTEYLVWVSKSEYKVRVYLGSKGNWSQVKEFTCAIGAPRTPTCEGTYKYYQAQKMWDYGSYYVGPIMRFNGGYAMHSTLIYKNGTPKDNRVGMQLSLGCVRLQPPDIGWMAYYVPLYTTIHITG